MSSCRRSHSIQDLPDHTCSRQSYNQYHHLTFSTMPQSRIPKMIQRHQDVVDRLWFYLNDESAETRRYLKGLQPADLVVLLQVFPEELKYQLFELTDPEVIGKVLLDLDVEVRARHLREFSAKYREKVLRTYDEREANKIRGELYICCNMNPIIDSIKGLTDVWNRGGLMAEREHDDDDDDEGAASDQYNAKSSTRTRTAEEPCTGPVCDPQKEEDVDGQEESVEKRHDKGDEGDEGDENSEGSESTGSSGSSDHSEDDEDEDDEMD